MFSNTLIMVFYMKKTESQLLLLLLSLEGLV